MLVENDYKAYPILTSPGATRTLEELGEVRNWSSPAWQRTRMTSGTCDADKARGLRCIWFGANVDPSPPKNE
jgi:hypothetical protein